MFHNIKICNIKWFRNVILYRRENQETRKLTLLLKESKIVFGFHQAQSNAIFDAIIKKKNISRGHSLL